MRLRKEHDGYSRGRGHPSRAEIAAMLPRADCRCPRCVAHFAELQEHALTVVAERRAKIVAQMVEDRPDDWRTHGLCVGLPPAVWFPGQGENPAVPKAICALCPSKQACLEFALDSGERFGIWGGTSERERRRLRTVAAA